MQEFANGPVTATTSYAFNQLQQGDGTQAEESSAQVTGCGSRLGCAPTDPPWIPEYFRWHPDGSNPMLDASAVAALTPLRLKQDGEWVGYIQFRAPAGYIASKAVFQQYQEQGDSLAVTFVVPRDAVAIYHTHPAMDRRAVGARAFNSAQNTFGPRDHHVVYGRGIPNYLKMPNGGISVLEMRPIGAVPRVVIPRRTAW